MILKDKVVLVTGGSQGIGKAVSLMFAAEHARVVINYGSDIANAERLINEIESDGGESMAIKADVSNPADVKEMFLKIVEKYGKVDILINNAGLAKKVSFFDITEENLINEFKLNIFSMVYCAQSAAKLMLENEGGRIVNISSICGISGCGSVLPFSMARSGLNSFTKSLSKDLAPTILVNTIAPGFTKTRFWDEMSSKEETELLKTTLTKKWVSPEDVAEACLMVAKNDSMTGQTIAVDGGYLTTI
jgi:3-oxoacyl-[acyl-carrier protein] reductase